MTEQIKICVNGSRTFNNYDYLDNKLKGYLKDKKDVVLIVGGARGADKLAEKWARINSVPFKLMEANWTALGKSAGYKRNQEMINIADELISFWDLDSRGTQHTIECARRKEIPVTIYSDWLE